MFKIIIDGCEIDQAAHTTELCMLLRKYSTEKCWDLDSVRIYIDDKPASGVQSFLIHHVMDLQEQIYKIYSRIHELECIKCVTEKANMVPDKE